MNLFRRELHGKYRGSVLGFVWRLVNPLALMAVYTLVFSVLLKAFQIEHYALFVLSGLVTWVFFQSAVQMSCSSLFAQPTLVKQVQVSHATFCRWPSSRPTSSPSEPCCSSSSSST